MSAQDNLNPQQFYHGTRHEFSPGDMVEPGHRSNWGRGSNWPMTEDTEGQYAYASTVPDKAAFYANQSSPLRATTPRVYRVEAAGDTEPDPEMPEHGVRSKKGFRAVGEVSMTVTHLTSLRGDDTTDAYLKEGLPKF